MRRPDQADYRRVLPPLLLDTFEFRSNNEAHQPVIQAIQPPARPAMCSPNYPRIAAQPF